MASLDHQLTTCRNLPSRLRVPKRLAARAMFYSTDSISTPSGMAPLPMAGATSISMVEEKPNGTLAAFSTQHRRMGAILRERMWYIF